MASYSWDGDHSQSFLELHSKAMQTSIALATSPSWGRNMDKSRLATSGE